MARVARVARVAGPGGEQSACRFGYVGHVDGFFFVEYLEIDQIGGSLVPADLCVDRAAGMELLGDVMVEGQHGDG